MKAVRVPKIEAEKIRKLAEKTGAKDKNRLIVVRDDFVEIPIKEGYEHLFGDYSIVEQEKPVFVSRKDLRSVLQGRIPSELEKYIPRRYKVLGDLILIKIPPELEEYKGLIGESLLGMHPRCRAVWRDLGREGMLRKPKVELIAGKGSETVHKENGCLFKLDVTKVMFSLGNQTEKMRVARMVEEGEVVVDMFAGIGYFSIPIAVHASPRRIYSIEINPDSYHYLLENIKLNEVSTIVPICGDSMFVTPEGVADRVIMGHLFCNEFLPVAIRALRNDGIIHYHESTPEAVIKRPIRRIEEACREAGKELKVLNFRKVKNYSPGVYHVVVDAYVH
jgi:tRNA wybutosine-synthesizing protein 2